MASIQMVCCTQCNILERLQPLLALCLNNCSFFILFYNFPIYVELLVENAPALFRDVKRMVPWLPRHTVELIYLLNLSIYSFVPDT